MVLRFSLVLIKINGLVVSENNLVHGNTNNGAPWACDIPNGPNQEIDLCVSK